MRLVLKKDWFSYLVIELFGQLSREEKAQEEPPTRNETKITKNRNTTEPAPQHQRRRKNWRINKNNHDISKELRMVQSQSRNWKGNWIIKKYLIR